jgi:AbrB family looped-hinge helix DNA binding protein
MSLATITSKGQVTIPIDIRNSLNLDAGDKIEFIVTKEGEAVLRLLSKKVDDVFGILRNPKQKAVSIDEMNEAIKNRFKHNSEI